MKKISETILFFGNEKLATGLTEVKPVIRQAITDAGFELEQIITGPPQTLRPHSAKLAVLAAYGYVVPRSVLDQFSKGILNIHPSLLPQYRGSSPVEQAILDGVTKTGVSIMHLSPKMDEGPIYKQKVVHLTGNETKAELASRLQRLGAELLLQVLPDIIADRLKPRAQPHADRATYTRKLTKADGLIDWRKPALQLEREIRAYAGWPNSRTNLAEREVIITMASVLKRRGSTGKPLIESGKLIIFCGQDALAIEQLKPAGKPQMSAQAFLAGYKNRL